MRLFGALIPALSFLGCWVGETPTPELRALEAGVGGETLSEICECSQESGEGGATGLEGRVYRFTQMVIEDPPALASTLNALWEGDLEAQILNVLFQVITAEPSQLRYPAREIQLNALSGWRTPSSILLEEGVEVQSFCGLPGTEAEISLEPADECSGDCRVRTVGHGGLNFFAGSQEEPINCAPHLAVPHAIPIVQVKARFNFDENCGRLIGGSLTACMAREEANKLCFCARGGGAAPCTMNENLDFAPPSGDDIASLSAYCRQCGASPWIPMGNILRSVEEPCDPPLGEQGIKISGIFTAEEITDIYTGTCEAPQ